MVEIYLMPIGSKSPVEHMNDTLINPVEASLIRSYLGEPEISNFNNAVTTSEIPVWGLEPGKANKLRWDTFCMGDIVIFVPSNQDILVTRIIHKVRDEKLAKRLWGTSSKSGQTWELVFFVDILSVLHIEKRALLDELGYDIKDNLMGNRRVTDRFFKRFDSVGSFIHKYSSFEVNIHSFNEEVADKILDYSVSKDEMLDTLRSKLEETTNSSEFIEISGKRIKRNIVIAKFAKVKADYSCQACGFTFIKKDGSRYVEAAHIQPLALSKLDTVRNIVALCPNCHKKLDYGNEKARLEVIAALNLLGP